MAINANAQRMSRAEAEAALVAVETQLATHAETCATCQAARDGTGFRIWRVCPTGAECVRTHLALSHRIHYLDAKARREQRTAESEQ